MTNASTWAKWDLHIHTPSSFTHNFTLAADEISNYGDIWEKYVHCLEQITDIVAIGVTDYFSIEGYRKLFEYRQKSRMRNIELLLPNIEFRLDKFFQQSSGLNRRFNYHVIFSDELSPDEIENEFLREVHITNPNSESRPLERRTLEEIGKALKRGHPPFQDRSDYEIGCMNVTVSQDEIRQILLNKASIFEGKYLLVLGSEGWTDLDWDAQDHLTRKQFYITSDAIFTANAGTRDWALGRREKSLHAFLEEFGATKPCIHGSDAHQFNRIGRPDLDRFCWIKASPTFDGLKQIVHEPEDRVLIQRESPDPRKSIYTLRSLEITGGQIRPGLTIPDQRIPLDAGLVAVIGGKGSGKTALLDLIVHIFEDRRRRVAPDPNSFVQRVETSAPDLRMRITFRNDEIFEKRLSDDAVFGLTRVTYLPQGKIEQYSGDQGKLHDQILQIIFRHPDVQASHEGLRVAAHESTRIAANLVALHREIAQFRSESEGSVLASIQKQALEREGALKDLNDKRLALETSMAADAQERVGALEEKVVDASTRIEDLESIVVEMSSIEEALAGIDGLNAQINDVNAKLELLDIPQRVPALDVAGQKDVIALAGLAVEAGVATTKTEQERIASEIETLSTQEKEHASLLQAIATVDAERQELIAQEAEVTRKRAEIVRLEGDRRNSYRALFRKHHEVRELYDSVIKAFSAEKDAIMKDVSFQSGIRFDRDRFVSLGEDIIDQRRIPLDRVRELADKVAMFTTNAPEVSAIDEYAASAELFAPSIKGTRTLEQFDTWVFGDYFSLTTAVAFGDVPMEKLSIGQKGTVLLQIFLADGEHPLIIDQPEENLDNRYVYEVLVGAFRQAKKKRQVIIATHNANLVVNTDAEQVIVAEYLNQEIRYQSGPLEDPRIRTAVTDLLEGGAEAFQRRERKYEFRARTIGY